MKYETYLFVEYKDSSSQWIYKCDGTFCVGDIVEAPTFNYALFNVAIVKKIVRLTDDELPIAKEKILTISKKLDKKEFEKDFHPLEFMKRRIRKDYLKEWNFINENDWIKIYQSTFGGQISFEQDGVLTCSIGDCIDEDFFERYTITSHRDSDIKLSYVQTLISLLHYKIITEQEFDELFNVV